MDRRLGSVVPAGTGRHLPVHGATHHVHDAAGRAEQLQLHPGEGAGLLRAPARAHHRYAGRVPGARSLRLLRVLGAHAHPDVLPHRGVGRAAPAVRRHQVLPVHVRWFAAHAGGDPDHLLLRGPRDGDLLVRLLPPAVEHPGHGSLGLLAVWRLLPGVCHQGAAVPVPHLVARRARRGADRGLGDPGGDPAEDGVLRVPALRAAILPQRGARSYGGDRGGRAGGHRHHLWRTRRHGAARLQEAGGLLVSGPPGLRDAGHLGGHGTESRGRDHHHDQPRDLHWSTVLPGRHAVRAASYAGDRGIRRAGQGRAGACCGADHSSALVGRVTGHQRVHR